MLTVNRLHGKNKSRLQSSASIWFKRLILVPALLVLAGLAQAQDVQLKKSSFAALPGQKLEVRLDFDAAPPAPKAYMIDSPPRLVLDFWGVSNELGSRQLDVKSGQVDSISFAQAEGRMRVVANLNAPVNYRTYSEDNSLFIEFAGVAGGSGMVGTPISKADRALVSTPKKRLADDRTRVEGIDFERLDGDQARIVVSMSDDKAGLDIIEEGNNIVVNLAGTSLSPNLEQRVDVQDFATPVMFIDSMISGSNTAILIKPSAQPYDYMAYQTGSQLILDFKPRAITDGRKDADRFPYSGEKIDLNFQDVSVRSILQIIAEVAEMNLVISDNVDKSAGNITLRLKNVPWDQALDIILKNKGLDKREVGNVLMIGTAEEIAEREKKELESQQQVKELAPLVTEFIQIDFRRASELKTHIETAKLISERGFVLADDQTNVLMIRETAAQIEEIRRTLRKFDVEVAQIMIEARIVTANTDYAKDLGVRWGFSDTAESLGNWSVGSTVNGIGGTNSGLQVDLGIPSAAGTFAVGFTSNSFLLSAELAALESDGKGEVISQPKVITTNGKPALIKSGQEIPYQTVENDEVQIEWKEVVLSLEVTPQLNPGNRIALDLVINQDNIGDTLETGEIALDTNQLQTSVVVNDGDTVVLGGVFKEESREDVDKVPFLGDLPIVGAAFRNKQEVKSKNELLIFITPKLVRESLTSVK